MKPHILTVPSSDSSSYYRGLGPLGRLRQLGLIDLTITNNIDWTILSQINLVFISRPDQASHKALIELAIKWGIPVWVDMDDDLFQVPSDNPSYGHYSKEETKRTLRECLCLADLVTVSTGALNERIIKFNKNTHTIPNALDPRINIQPPSFTSKTILWRGSATHDRDLETYLYAIVSAAKDMPGWHWHFQGYNPWRLTERLSEFGIVSWDKPLPIEQYMETISDLCPAIMIVPLHDSEFNHAKSNIAWIEASYVGARTLAPNWPEWIKPGVFNYTDPESFTQQLIDMMNMPVVPHTESMKYIEQNLMLDHVNQLRLDLIRKTVKMGA